MPSEGTWYAPRIVEGSRSGIFSVVSAGVEQLGPLEPVRAREPEPPLQLPHPRLGGRDLDPAHAVPGGFTVDVQRGVQHDRLLGDPAHHPGAVGLEREPGRVRARTPGLEQRTLVEHEHVALAELGQVVGGAGADDPGAPRRFGRGPSRPGALHDTQSSAHGTGRQPRYGFAGHIRGIEYFMASYTVNRRGMAQARKLIKARRYVLNSNWGDVQPKAADETPS